MPASVNKKNRAHRRGSPKPIEAVAPRSASPLDPAAAVEGAPCHRRGSCSHRGGSPAAAKEGAPCSRRGSRNCRGGSPALSLWSPVEADPPWSSVEERLHHPRSAVASSGRAAPRCGIHAELPCAAAQRGWVAPLAAGKVPPAPWPCSRAARRGRRGH
jgi:hypothetical protein